MDNVMDKALSVSYDPEHGLAYIKLGEGKYVESEQVTPDIVLDFDENGAIVGIELLNANLHLPENLRHAKP
jgi:uncharacterized protein YuzE